MKRKPRDPKKVPPRNSGATNEEDWRGTQPEPGSRREAIFNALSVNPGIVEDLSDEDTLALADYVEVELRRTVDEN